MAEKTVDVKMLTYQAGLDFERKANEVYPVSPEEAERMVKAGIAELVRGGRAKETTSKKTPGKETT